MTSVTTKDSFKIAVRPGKPSGEPLSVVTLFFGREMAGALDVFAESTSVVRIQEHLADCGREDEAVSAWLGEPAPDICIIDLDRDFHRANLAAERIRLEAPQTAIFAISSQSQPDLIIEAMRNGCREYLRKPLDPEQLLQAVSRVKGRKKDKDKKEAGTGQVLVFMGAKGGSGVTTLVTQLGALLAKRESKTLILDLHPEFGDTALYLGLRKFRYHSYELLQNTDRLDNELLQSFILHHPSGVDVIPAPQGVEPIRDMGPGSTPQLIDFLRSRYDFVLVDVQPGFSQQNLELIHICDALYLVTVAEVSAIRNVVHQCDYFSRNNGTGDKIRVVLNRFQKRSTISEAEIEKAIRRKIYWKVPNQYSHVLKTIHTGDPIGNMSSSDVTRNLQGWADSLDQKDIDEKRSQGILGLFGR